MIFKPIDNISKRDFNNKSIFLAGSIEMGKAILWQDIICLDKDINLNYNIFNPRRDDWDSSWKQEFSNPQFSQQVNWELNALDKSDIIVFYFDPNTKSPITLLELGLYIDKGKRLVVCCPDGYWRKGNVDIVCNKYNIEQVDNIDELIYTLKQNI